MSFASSGRTAPFRPGQPSRQHGCGQCAFPTTAAPHPRRKVQRAPLTRGIAQARGRHDKPFRYALRLIKEDGRWRVEQREDVRSRYDHTADPVADILWSMG